MSKTQTVHFSVGEDLGLRLMEIAQEHLTERNNPIQALKTITESLGGCSNELAIQILKGDLVLPVDVETQEVICQPRIIGVHDIFPKIDINNFIENRTNKIKKYGGYIIDAFNDFEKKRYVNNNHITINFNYEDIFKFVSGDDDVMLDELRDNYEIDSISNLFETTQKFIEETMKAQSTMDWMMKTFDEYNHDIAMQFRDEIADILYDIRLYLNKAISSDFILKAPADNVQQYIDSAIEIDKILSKGIEPVNILKNYSAGWLAPNGDYYALNGEIANMLHNQIAKALYDINIIPQNKENERNPDAWLEQQGWVKIHENNIHFSGCLNFRLGKKNIDLTNVQIRKIYEYCSLCHNGIIEAGWKMEPMSVTRFRDMAEIDLEKLYKLYFEF